MVDKKTQEEILKGMDEAAEKAKADFNTLPEETRKLAAAWVRKWYLKAGYKRLGRFLVVYAKSYEEKETTG
ncbi:hypothetical protein AMJ87_03530 [candidate division WOR_3 bacterium SM23_60]|uniref:PFL domain-containing protein n=1 Tax=candidate division WOR_3 bacterium SM23_60 TaxID=1703780 RepID=A0A0S8GLW7_UNCW3|nr:MAG: hypothetical protein AMJ87_03530 [candidate division WOR_3 bacterium SM23_60]